MVRPKDQGVEVRPALGMQGVVGAERRQRATISGESEPEQSCPAVGEEAPEAVYVSRQRPCMIQKKACMLPNHDGSFRCSWLLHT